MKKNKKPLYLVLSGCVLVGLSLFVGNNSLLSSILDGQNEPLCYLSSEIESYRVEKMNPLVAEREQARPQLESLTERIASNSALLASAEADLVSAQKEVLSDEEMTRREQEVTDLLTQKEQKEVLEGLEKDMQSKQSIAETDKKKASDLFLAVGPKKSAYDAAVVQYELKKGLGVELVALRALPRPTSAQRNARRTLEAQALAADPSKRPTDAQMTDRKKLEELLIARDAAKRNIPTSNKAPGYQAAVNAHNALKKQYDLDLAAYKSKYASSPFAVTLTYAQLTTKLNQYNTALTKYNTTLATYDTTYPTNKTLTLVELDAQITAYNTANTVYTARLTQYNTTYATTKNKTEAQLLVVVNNLKAPYDTAEAVYRVAQKTSDTSLQASEGARATYEETNQAYLVAYPGDARSAQKIGEEYTVKKASYDTLVQENERKKGILTERLTERDKYAALGEENDAQKRDIDILIRSIEEKMTVVENDIQLMNTKVCPETETGLCSDGLDNDRDGTVDCSDGECGSDPVCHAQPVELLAGVQCSDGRTLQPGESIELCSAPTTQCGNGVQEQGEACDDGNTNNEDTNYGDTCSSDCQTITGMRCGNGTVEPSIGETCDEGANNGLSMGSCSNTCQRVETYNYTWGPVCGNGTQETGEACDDGNTMSGDGCSASCQWDMMAAAESCGNGVCEGSETSGTCPGDCMGGTENYITENKISEINECGDLICGESETEMSCQTDCNSMRPFAFLDMTESQIRTHEFTQEELDELTSENIDELIAFFERYDRFLSREIEKLERLGGQYGYCNNDVNCENNIRQQLEEYSMSYSINHGPLNFFLAHLENFFIPKSFAGVDIQQYFANRQRQLEANKAKVGGNINKAKGSSSKTGVCCVCIYGDLNSDTTFKKGCDQLFKENSCTKKTSVYGEFGNDIQQAISDFPNQCPANKYKDVKLLWMEHGEKDGEERKFCYDIPSDIILGYAFEQGEVPANIEIENGACNAFNDIEEAKVYAEKLHISLKESGLQYVTITIKANQNMSGGPNGTINNNICAGTAEFNVCSQYANVTFRDCPVSGSLESICLFNEDNNPTIQCMENGVQTTKTCVDTGVVNNIGTPIGIYQ